MRSRRWKKVWGGEGGANKRYPRKKIWWLKRRKRESLRKREKKSFLLFSSFFRTHLPHSGKKVFFAVPPPLPPPPPPRKRFFLLPKNVNWSWRTRGLPTHQKKLSRALGARKKALGKLETNEQTDVPHVFTGCPNKKQLLFFVLERTICYYKK